MEAFLQQSAGATRWADSHGMEAAANLAGAGSLPQVHGVVGPPGGCEVLVEALTRRGPVSMGLRSRLCQGGTRQNGGWTCEGWWGGADWHARLKYA